MIRLGFRLATAGGRHGLTRLAVTIVGSAVGVALILLAAGLEPAMVARGERLAQRVPDKHLTALPTLEPDVAAPDDVLLLETTEHHIGGHRVTIVDVAATGEAAPTPPGLSQAPRPGEVYLSPAFRRTDAEPLALVTGFDDVGTIADAGLADPSEFVAWRGWDVETFRKSVAQPVVIRAFPLDAPERAWWASEVARRVGVAGAALVLLVPVLVFIGVMVRLGALQRQRRLAALSLVGATPKQLRSFAVAEGLIVGGVAVVLALPVAAAARYGLAKVSIGGHAWFPADLQPRPSALVAVAVAIPVVSAVAGLLSVRGLTSSPLGVVARSSSRPASKWRATVALAGLVLVMIAAFSADALAPTVVTLLTVGGAGLVMFGLPAAGPWVIRQVAQRATRHTSDGALLIAARRVDDDPAAAFRASSGIVLAVFSVTLVLGYVTGNLGDESRVTMPAGVDAVVHTATVDPAVATALADGLRTTDGVETVTTVRRLLDSDGHPVLFADCDELNATGIAKLHPCPASGWSTDSAHLPAVEFVSPDGDDSIVPTTDGTLVHERSTLVFLGADVVLPLSEIPERMADDVTVTFIAVRADPTGLDAAAAVVGGAPGVRLETAATRSHSMNVALTEARRGVLLLCLIVLLVGAASLVATLLGGLLSERSTLVHLRRLGLMRRNLMRMMLWQSLLPLVATVPLVVVIGIAVSGGFTHAVGGRFSPPIGLLTALAAAAMAGGAAFVAAAYPALERNTRPEVANAE